MRLENLPRIKWHAKKMSEQMKTKRHRGMTLDHFKFTNPNESWLLLGMAGDFVTAFCAQCPYNSHANVSSFNGYL